MLLVEIQAATDAAGTTTTLRAATGKGHVTRTGETPAKVIYEPRLITPGNFERHIFGSGRTFGQSEVGFGVIELNNADGALDAWINYGFDNRTLTIRRGPKRGAYPADFPVVFQGTMEQIEFTHRRVRIKMRDPLASVADLPMQTTLYAGTNSGATGHEGTATDLKGKKKPKLYGVVKNIGVPCVNVPKLAFQVSDAQINSLDNVYAKGSTITRGTAHASLAALWAAAVAGGTFDYYLGSGSDGAYFRLGTTPTGTVTCDATEGANAAARTAAQIAKRILTGPGGAAASTALNNSVTALDTANSAEVGFWTGIEDYKVGIVLDAVLSTVGGYWLSDRAGDYIFGRLEVPSGTPVQTIESWLLLDRGEPIERLSSSDPGVGIPAWRVNIEYQRCWTVQGATDTVDGGVARLVFTEQEWRLAVASDATVKTKHPLAPEMTFQCLFDTEAAASAEASRRLTMYSTRRDYIRIAVPSDQIEGIDLADVISLKVARYSWNAGKLLRVMGIVEDYARNVSILECWG